ncbi:SpoIIE family protein phosphatase [Luteipulveratus flavus]|uniref:SpoIIE family protein phosphatase n=1 Tax=Luteipulveratus flavus TaxID=3031728 RepID=A0ABT6C7C8_9MICO|nr:SpoIIE family protein phosphatase [Luteipulveratus sp. YIM 133296]MDF8264839.1 SpoIIE family protein phosphatase [Luteipulveratus sp. YIM 133296]
MSTPEQEAGRAGDAEDVRRAFDEMPLAQVALDGPEHRFVAANAAYRAIVGRADVIGRSVREVTPEVSGQPFFEMLDQVCATGEPVVAREWRVRLNRGADGASEDLYLDVNVLPRPSATGETTGLLVYLADATARVRQQQAAQREAAEAERRYEAARDVVVELQEALLPTALPVLPGATVAARYLVAAVDQAAGDDWFDAVPLRDGRLALVVGDIVGHGVAATAAMGQLRVVLSEMLRETADARHAVAWADRMAARTPTMRAATVGVVVLDPATGALDYLTCGHPAPLVVQADGSARYLPASGGGPLGTEGDRISAQSTLDPGALVVLYSDGLVKRPGEVLSTGLDRLARVAGDAVGNRALPAGAPTSAAERACQLSVKQLTRTGYDDDVTMLACERRAESVGAWRWRRDPAGLDDLRPRLREWLAGIGVEHRDVQHLEIALTELVANAVEHAYADRPPGEGPGPVEVVAELEADGVARIRVDDEGRWQPPFGPVPTSGRGLWLVESMVEEMAIVRGGTSDDPAGAGTAVTVRHRLHRPALPGAEPPAVPLRREGTFAAVLEGGPPRRLVVSGPVDIATAEELSERVAYAGRGGLYPLVVDLSGVEILASAGVRVLLELRDRLAVHGHPLQLVAAADTPAAQVLDLLDLDHEARPLASPDIIS